MKAHSFFANGLTFLDNPERHGYLIDIKPGNILQSKGLPWKLGTNIDQHLPKAQQALSQLKSYFFAQCGCITPRK
jgi:hypothetical protein